jgi:hypothetical protein
VERQARREPVVRQVLREPVGGQDHREPVVRQVLREPAGQREYQGLVVWREQPGAVGKVVCKKVGQT